MLWIIVGQNMINIMNHVFLEMLCTAHAGHISANTYHAEVISLGWPEGGDCMNNQRTTSPL